MLFNFFEGRDWIMRITLNSVKSRVHPGLLHSVSRISQISLAVDFLMALEQAVDDICFESWSHGGWLMLV